jgi:hypothetical protein
VKSLSRGTIKIWRKKLANFLCKKLKERERECERVRDTELRVKETERKVLKSQKDKNQNDRVRHYRQSSIQKWKWGNL